MASSAITLKEARVMLEEFRNRGREDRFVIPKPENAVARSLTNSVDGAPPADRRKRASLRRSVAILAAMPTDGRLSAVLEDLWDQESGAGLGTGAIRPTD